MVDATRTVLILAFAEMEVLDYAGPYEVFNVAGELTDPKTFQVRSVGVKPGRVVARGGFTVVPDHSLADAPPADLLIIPGGAGSRRLLDNAELLDWVRTRATATELIASVCTGALLLAAAGLLEDCAATTHHGAFDELARLSPSTAIVSDQRYVHSAPGLWTSGGISAGIDLSLALVEELAGAGARDVVVAEMEWGWHLRR